MSMSMSSSSASASASALHRGGATDRMPMRGRASMTNSSSSSISSSGRRVPTPSNNDNSSGKLLDKFSNSSSKGTFTSDYNNNVFYQQGSSSSSRAALESTSKGYNNNPISRPLSTTSSSNTNSATLGGGGGGDSLDRAFSAYMKEVEISYSNYPKSIRLRIERWIEKLCETSSNDLWKKHRNSYAKLLLNMILSGHSGGCINSNPLQQPFDQPPPVDSPLPPFPSHLIGVSKELKNSLGSRESAFWRDIFKKISINSKGGQLEKHQNGNTANDNDNTMMMSEFGKKNTIINSNISNIDAASFDHDLELELAYDLIGGGHPVKDIQNLQVLVKNQNAKIEILEQQLKDMRVKHELEVQRLRYSHKQEVDSYKLLSSNPLEELLMKSNVSLGNFSNYSRAAGPTPPTAHLSHPTATSSASIKVKGTLSDESTKEGGGRSENYNISSYNMSNGKSNISNSSKNSSNNNNADNYKSSSGSSNPITSPSLVAIPVNKCDAVGRVNVSPSASDSDDISSNIDNPNSSSPSKSNTNPLLDDSRRPISWTASSPLAERSANPSLDAVPISASSFDAKTKLASNSSTTGISSTSSTSSYNNNKHNNNDDDNNNYNHITSNNNNSSANHSSNRNFNILANRFESPLGSSSGGSSRAQASAPASSYSSTSFNRSNEDLLQFVTKFQTDLRGLSSL